MDVFEYQAKGLLSRYGIPIPEGKVVKDVGEARAAVELGFPVAIKA